MCSPAEMKKGYSGSITIPRWIYPLDHQPKSLVSKLITGDLLHFPCM